MDKKKKIGVMCACFNEEENVEKLVEAIFDAVEPISHAYDFEILFIDNNSTDSTQQILKKLSADSRIKCIFNEQNYNANKSSFHGMINCPGDAVIMICADFQDPPELVPQLILKWDDGNRVVMARKKSSRDGLLMKMMRRLYYQALKIAHPNSRAIINCTGFGIYDRTIIERLKNVRDVSPFFRGMVSEMCADIAYVDYHRPERIFGKTSMSFAKLWDEGIIGLISNSKFLLRLVTLMGVCFGVFSIVSALVIFTLKIVFWDTLPIGIAPLLILQFLFIGIVMTALGIMGEYLGAIYLQVIGRERVYERERINI